MDDWRGYDSVAEDYDRLWGPRFEIAAGHLLELAPPTPGSRLLDVGAGTGAVASAVGDRQDGVAIVGCDLSGPMLEQGRRRIPGFRAVIADATSLPFRDGSFDLVTANCVLSHVSDFRQALAETLRVLRRQGRLAVSSWGPASDPYTAAWEKMVATALGEHDVTRATEVVTPWASHFSKPDRLRIELLEAGFTNVRTETIEMRIRCRLNEYLAERELGAAGRFGREALGRSQWFTFVERAERQFRRRFGDRLAYVRPLIVAIAATR